jgi:hypothetical protein
MPTRNRISNAMRRLSSSSRNSATRRPSSFSSPSSAMRRLSSPSSHSSALRLRLRRISRLPPIPRLNRKPRPRTSTNADRSETQRQPDRPTASRGPVCVRDAGESLRQENAGVADRLKTERAARQQGGSFLRENSSNGGKTIRAFWQHSRGMGWECQEEIWAEINSFNSMT